MRKAFITGGSKGIGKAIAKKFRESGYEVIIPTRQELDLRKGESIQQYIKLHQDQYYDVIINNAGCNDINNMEDITDEEIDTMLAVNLIAPMKLIRGFLPKMKENQYGKIVNIGSIWAVVSKAGRCVYSVTKNGIHGITLTLAVEVAKDNILVNTVCPGFTLTELTKKNNTEEEIFAIADEIPCKRMADPAEIAELVYFLCSEKNTYLTGQKITVDGGYTSK